jgi:hypothetical protein
VTNPPTINAACCLSLTVVGRSGPKQQQLYPLHTQITLIPKFRYCRLTLHVNADIHVTQLSHDVDYTWPLHGTRTTASTRRLSQHPAPYLAALPQTRDRAVSGKAASILIEKWRLLQSLNQRTPNMRPTMSLGPSPATTLHMHRDPSRMHDRQHMQVGRRAPMMQICRDNGQRHIATTRRPHCCCHRRQNGVTTIST